MEKRILLNEIGYQPMDAKLAVYRGETEVTFDVVKESGQKDTVVFHGVSSKGIYSESAKETDFTLDFSGVKESGDYYLLVNGEKSDVFSIGENVYDDINKKMMRFYYLQRCGLDLPQEYAGKFAHPKCHNTKARIYGTEQFIDVNGGWHDAGDYGRYIVAAAVTIAALFHAIENEQNFMDYQLNIPESGQKCPDILAEIRYELEWMLKMQDESGRVYHKVTCASFCDFVMPQDETEELIVCPFSLTATADFASCMAMAVKFYAPFDADFATRLEEASKKAYSVMKTIQVPGGFLNPEGVVTGSYEDPYEEDELYWAAAELYKAFGEEQYRNDFESFVSKEIWHGYGWEDVASFGNIAYLSAGYPINEELASKIKKSMIEKADKLLAICNKDGYGISFRPKDYIWGSNMYIAENGSHLYDAYKLTGKEEYLHAAQEHIHYLFGKNPCGICFVTGCGTDSVKDPHHRPSSVIKQAMPGMVIGGPNYRLQDPDAIASCTGKAPAKCFVDTLLSYSTNEETIYWNSATLMLMGQVF